MEPSVWHAVSVAGRVCLIALILLACLGVPAAAQSAPQNTSVSLARPGRMPA